jgi:hypothetical protein
VGPGTYSLEVYQNTFVGGGAYAVYDGLTLDGIPEPATALLLSLGLFAVARRRR